MSFGSSKLAGMPVGQRDQLVSCVKLLLLWVAASDGQVEDSELEFASTQFPDTEGAVSTDDLLSVIRNTDLATIELAIRTLAAESRELRTAFLDLAITMSMADRQIAITENHILRFYADALYLGLGMLQKRFQAICGVPFAEPGDPGDLAWWDQLGTAARGSEPDANRLGQRATPGPGMNMEAARAALGVARDAMPSDIERAYQNLVGIFQVDRVETMGAAAIAVANKRLQKIEEAYRILRAGA
jgi:DnaJ-domain-containing protein 1